MIIDCISDLHGHYPQLEGGDLLIVAGDLTRSDSLEDWAEFVMWLEFHCLSRYKKIITIGGNHDNLLQEKGRNLLPVSINYICDSGTEFEYMEKMLNPFYTDTIEGSFPSGNNIPEFNYITKKLTIWGSPWTKRFPGMNPKCTAFTVDTEEELAEKFALIPENVNILITHGPPYGIGDDIYDYFTGQIECVGDMKLARRISKIKPKLHVFGHVHEGYGEYREINKQWIKNNSPSTIFVNASHVNEHYEPVNKPIRIEL